MEAQLIDRDQLVQFVDALVAAKYPNQPEKILTIDRERYVVELNDYIMNGIAKGLDDSSIEKLDKILEDPASDTDSIKEFFASTGTSLDDRISTAMAEYTRKFMEVENEQ
ncbi:hypothetical protein IKF12_03395 [Candidatus Saccharibacteria bacterium]|nr:hypothetical protein [Candidatus Saccharibacteria bacterium]